MEGIWFYWVTWMGWIVVTFFLKKGELRFKLALFILLYIISAHYVFSFHEINISLGFLILLGMSYVLVSGLPNHKLFYFFICSVILSFSYVSFFLFKLFDPVWVIINPAFMLAFILMYLVIILVKDIKTRVNLFLFGSCHGELLYGLIMNYFTFPHIVGYLSFFDAVAIGLVFMTFWYGFERISAYINQVALKSNKRRAGI